jgi:hypothetical protein
LFTVSVNFRICQATIFALEEAAKRFGSRHFVVQVGSGGTGETLSQIIAHF